MNGTCCSSSGGGGRFGSGGIPIFVTGPQGTGKTSLVQTIVNAAIDSETMATRTNNNNYDDNIADEPGLIPIYINLATSQDSWIQTIYQSVEMKLKVGDYTDQKPSDERGSNSTT